MDKIQKDKICWINYYNNVQKNKLFEGNRIRQ